MRRPPVPAGAALGGAGAGGDLVGGYHWDCSDWCGGGALPGISEVAGSERRDSSSPDAPPPASRPDSAPDDLDLDAPPRFADGEH